MVTTLRRNVFRYVKRAHASTFYAIIVERRILFVPLNFPDTAARLKAPVKKITRFFLAPFPRKESIDDAATALFFVPTAFVDRFILTKVLVKTCLYDKEEEE